MTWVDEDATLDQLLRGDGSATGEREVDSSVQLLIAKTADVSSH